MSRRSRRQRNRPRRNPLPGPPPPGPPAVRAPASRAAASERPRRLLERDAPFIGGELVRIAIISAVCGGLLAALVLIDRLR
ncbi:MAG: hypothetical protein F4Z25_10955 [Chloroflexi bacterium]|nr:hypothetical protein [Chloroflexota bacterium]MYE46976.1 hypothetical protein [Chloroflexota bacterium]